MHKTFFIGKEVFYDLKKIIYQIVIFFLAKKKFLVQSIVEMEPIRSHSPNPCYSYKVFGWRVTNSANSKLIQYETFNKLGVTLQLVKGGSDQSWRMTNFA